MNSDTDNDNIIALPDSEAERVAYRAVSHSLLIFEVSLNSSRRTELTANAIASMQRPPRLHLFNCS